MEETHKLNLKKDFTKTEYFHNSLTKRNNYFKSFFLLNCKHMLIDLCWWTNIMYEPPFFCAQPHSKTTGSASGLARNQWNSHLTISKNQSHWIILSDKLIVLLHICVLLKSLSLKTKLIAASFLALCVKNFIPKQLNGWRIIYVIWTSVIVTRITYYWHERVLLNLASVIICHSQTLGLYK